MLEDSLYLRDLEMPVLNRLQQDIKGWSSATHYITIMYFVSAFAFF
jgi:hypothetical protein